METMQRKLGVFLVVTLIAWAMMATTVIAEEAKKNNSLHVKAGIFEPTGDADDVGYETGGDITIAYSRYLSDMLVIEGGISFFGTGMDSEGYSDAAGNYSKDNCLGTTAFLLTLKGEYPFGPVDLFGGAGVGLYAVYLDSEIDTGNLGSFDLDDNDTVFGAHIVAGANYNINEHFFLGLEGSYRWTGDIDLIESDATIPAHFEGDLSGFTISLAGGFRF